MMGALIVASQTSSRETTPENGTTTPPMGDDKDEDDWCYERRSMILRDILVRCLRILMFYNVRFLAKAKDSSSIDHTCRWRLIFLSSTLTPPPMSTDTIRVSQTRVYIVRHGETEENKQKIIQGHLDTILNSEGERQADLVAKALKDISFDVAYSSNLKRATDTAKRILVHHSGVEVQTHIAIRERVRRKLGYPVCLSVIDAN
jgi:hypothetical protein